MNWMYPPPQEYTKDRGIQGVLHVYPPLGAIKKNFVNSNVAKIFIFGLYYDISRFMSITRFPSVNTRDIGFQINFILCLSLDHLQCTVLICKEDG